MPWKDFSGSAHGFFFLISNKFHENLWFTDRDLRSSTIVNLL